MKGKLEKTFLVAAILIGLIVILYKTGVVAGFIEFFFYRGGLYAFVGGGMLLFWIFLLLLPLIITTWIMSYKGYSGCLWFFIFCCLSWIGVIIALCMPNIRREEERHRETIAAITSQNHSQTVILNNQEKEQTQQTPSSPSAKDFRLQAIRNLKATGKPFDEYDLELEIERIKNETK
jgi:hypothetical protein